MARSASVSTPPAASPEASALTIATSDDGHRIALAGALDIRTLAEAEAALARGPKSRAVDIGNLSSLDTPGALLLCRLREQGIALAHTQPEHQSLLDLICGLPRQALPKPKSAARWRQMVIDVGKGADDAWRDMLDITSFVGHVASVAGQVLIHPSRLRPAAISRHVNETGVDALPIIALMAVLISVVIGYQGVAQLRPYGGEDFTINLVAVSMLREMGVLITAIMVAGRSGSAFAAEIGVMKSREEIDALRVMGLEPMELLVLPRLIALVITLPLLTFFADIMGLVGGAMISQGLLHVSPSTR